MSEILEVIQQGRPPICMVKCICGRIYRASGWKHYFRKLKTCVNCRINWSSEQAKEMRRRQLNDD